MTCLRQENVSVTTGRQGDTRQGMWSSNRNAIQVSSEVEHDIVKTRVPWYLATIWTPRCITSDCLAYTLLVGQFLWVIWIFLLFIGWSKLLDLLRMLFFPARKISGRSIAKTIRIVMSEKRMTHLSWLEHSYSRKQMLSPESCGPIGLCWCRFGGLCNALTRRCLQERPETAGRSHGSPPYSVGT